LTKFDLSGDSTKTWADKLIQSLLHPSPFLRFINPSSPTLKEIGHKVIDLTVRQTTGQ